MSTEETYDPYDLAEGATLGEGVVTIESSSFGFDAQYGEGTVPVAILEGKVVSDGETYDWRKLYSIGKGWEVVEAGARVQREDGRPANFRKTSKYGLWLAGALSCEGVGQILRKRGTPMQAPIWVGLTFDVRNKETDYGGDIGKKGTLVPVAFLGEAGKASAATSTPAAPAAAALAVSATGISGALKAKLRKLAQECDTHDAFVDRAFVEVDGVDGNKEAEALVADSPDFYNSLRG